MPLIQYYVTNTKETTPDEITENARYEFESDDEYCIEDGDLSGFSVSSGTVGINSWSQYP